MGRTGKEPVVVRTRDGQEWEIHQAPRARPGKPSQTKVYKRVPHVRGRRVKGGVGIVTGSHQLVRATREEQQRVAERLQEIKREGDRERDWRLRWSWRVGRAWAWLLELFRKAWRRIRR